MYIAMHHLLIFSHYWTRTKDFNTEIGTFRHFVDTILVLIDGKPIFDGDTRLKA